MSGLTIMVDLEGTLSDHTHRLAVLRHATQHDERDRDAWKNYYKGLPDDEPRHQVMRAVRYWISHGNKIIVYSTRFQNKYNHEEEWLRGHELWEDVELLQRQQTKEERAIPGPNLVAIWAHEIKPDIIVDDREENRRAVELTTENIVIMKPEEFDNDPPT